jgi:peroxisomal 2,4-dienoyl-CoA reductase
MDKDDKSPFRTDVLEGRVALVTGGGSGIGLEISKQLGLHGARVVISGRRKPVLENACSLLSNQGISTHYVQGDVRSYTDCERMVSEAVESFGSLDILVNCAAGNFLAPAEQLTSNGFKTVMEIDALGTFNASRAAFQALSKSSNASIVNISATLHYGATWYQAHASAAKAAVDSLTRTLGLEWGSHGIRVNGIAPGPIEGTAGLTKLAPGGAEQLRKLWKERIPVGHPGQAWDIATSVVYLASSGARYINGHTLVVDGAEWMYREPLVPRDKVLQASRSIEAKSRRTGIAAKSKL